MTPTFAAPAYDAARCPWRYRACALEIASAVPLPALIDGAADTDGAGPPDAVFLAGAVPERLEGPLDHEGPNWALAGDRFLLHVPGIGSFLVAGGNTVTFAAAPGLAPEELAAFLTGSVMGMLLHMRGSVVLHGSAVAVPGGAILLCGPSGAGKSTLAAALGQRGLPMLSDDICALFEGPGGLVVHPDGRRHKLWARAIESLGLGARQGEAVRQQIGKFHVAPGATVSEPRPVLAVVELRENRADATVSLEPASLPDAAVILRRNAYRPRIMWALDHKGAYFRTAVAVARLGGVHVLHRPLDFARMDAVIDTVVARWAGGQGEDRGGNGAA